MNRRDVRAVPVDDKMAVTIKKVGVIGSGQMGNGIAHVAALAGFDVVLNDVSDERLKSAMATINGHLSRQVAKKAITEDARKYVQREVRRGSKYEGIILDPPKYGRGPKGEVWNIFEHLRPLLRTCRELLSDDALFLILTAYSIRASFLSIHELAAECLDGAGGLLESGEQTILNHRVELTTGRRGARLVRVRPFTVRVWRMLEGRKG